MAQRTLARLYDTHDAGAEVVRRLEAAGIPQSDISIISRDPNAPLTVDPAVTPATDPTAPHTMAPPPESRTAAGTGASIGTVLGGAAGLLAGIGALAIPGVGPVVAAGWLVATLAGAGVGAAAGGIAGLLVGAGVSQEEAHVYDEGVRRGGTLVTVRADDADAARVQQILDHGEPEDWRSRGAAFRAEGWRPGATNPSHGTALPVPGANIPPPAENSIFGEPVREEEDLNRLRE